MPKVVRTVKQDGLIFEVYADGDCVLTNATVGYVQISREVLAALVSGSDVAAQRKEPVSGRRHVPSDAHAETIRDAKPDTHPFNIHKVENGAGWQCSFLDGRQHTVHHVYASRSLARAGSLSNPIGTAGRIA